MIRSKYRAVLIGFGIILLLLVGLISFLKFNKSENSEKAGDAESSQVKSGEVLSNETYITDSQRIISPTPSFIQDKNLESAVIVKVVDGDTITVNLNGQKQTIRIIGINTPETVDPRRGVECFGRQASDRAKEYFKSKNYVVWLEKDNSQGEYDKYQRLLRYVFTDNGTIDYGLGMILEGYAYEYTYDTPYKYQTAYKNAQKNSEEKGLGLWADESCSGNASTSQVVGSSTSQVGTSKSVEEDRDCKDFATQKEAQDFFISQGGPGIDPHKLDGDKDGITCESLP